jgi:hypothetical protein
MDDPKQIASDRRLLAVFGVISAILCAFQVKILITALNESSRGVPEFLPNQHQDVVLGAVSGMCLALILPFPFLLSQLSNRRRAVRFCAWFIWAALLATSMGIMVYQNQVLGF